MKRSSCLLVLVPLFSLLACNTEDGERNIAGFYFPLPELKEGKVYEYEPVGNEHDPPMFWYYKSMRQEGREYLLGMGYDAELLPDQFVREEKVSNGMLLVDFYTYERKDSASAKTQVQADIIAGNVFPFFVKQPANVLLTSLSWLPPADNGSRINVVRNRQFDTDTVFVFNGKKIPAVKFNTIELVEHDNQGRLPLEFAGSEIYAKGIGLVALQKNISEAYRLAYRLKAVYSMREFEEKFKVSLEQ